MAKTPEQEGAEYIAKAEQERVAIDALIEPFVLSGDSDSFIEYLNSFVDCGDANQPLMLRLAKAAFTDSCLRIGMRHLNQRRS